MILEFHGGPHLPDGSFLANAQKAQARLEILLQDEKPHGRRLAVVGGGPSALRHLDEIRTFDSVWGINETWRFLESHGINATLFSIDAGSELVPMAKGAKSAVLASRSDPGVWDVLDCVPTVLNAFDDGPNPVIGGSSSATCAFHAAIKLGYREIKLFGCDSSFEKTTHAYRNEERPFILVVTCNGGEYATAPDFYTQAKELKMLCGMFPKVISQSGDGLLGAMIENDDHDVVRVNKALAEKMGVPCTN